jgi:large subunit ribosomal protein L9
MKVLLCEDIKKLGWLGDVVEVTTGYARNYLLPQGKAKPATESNIKAIAQEKARAAEARILETKRLEQAAGSVEGAEAVLAAKANEQGHLFGSVTEPMIAANLREQGFQVADEIVVLAEHIKEVGEHEVVLRFSDEVSVKVKVTVVAEGAEPADAEAADADAADATGEPEAATETPEP